MSEKNLYTNLEKSKSDKLNYVLKILPNGLKVLFISDPEATESSAALGVNIGNLTDPLDAQGLAHFCEHLLFMGTEKYTKENEYEDYLAKNNGNSNAYTSDDRTVFYFNVSNEGFDGAIERFAQFFICPTFDSGSVEREINAVDSEFSKNKNNDARRLYQLIKSESKKNSSFCKFSTGSKETLGLPDIRDRLLAMYKKYYSSEIMNLCVYSIKPMEELIKMVEELFVLVPKRDNFIMPRFDKVFPYDETNLKYLYKIMPVKDQDNIRFSWFLPFCDNYHAKPIEYLIYFLGHEGPNTLTSSLRKDNLITELVSSPSDYAKTFSVFNIEIALTKKGLENYKETILRVLKYIDTVRALGVNERYFNEIKEISQIKFDFKNKSSPSENTTTYTSNLIDYKPEDVLTGSTLYKEYNKPLIKKYIDLLTMENLNIYFFSKSFGNDCKLSEKYYGTKYNKEKIPFTQEEIDAYKCEHVFDYPPENKFIPKNLDVLPIENEPKKYPEKILDKKNCNVWFLKDNKFQLPKATIGIQFKLPKNYCNNSIIKNYVLSYLLQKIVNKELAETSYMATEAKFKLKLKINFYRVKIRIKGFNDSFKAGVFEIFSLFKSLNLNSDYHKEVLKLQIKELNKAYMNLFLSRSYLVNIHYFKTLTTEPKIEPEEVLNFLKEEEIKIEDIIEFQNHLFDNVKADWLIQGNMTKENALDIVKIINNALNIDIEKDTTKLYYYKRLVDINKNYNFIYRFKNPNPEEKDSSLSRIYRAGHLSGINVQYFNLVYSFLEEKFFDQLRTKETLGYIVQLMKRTKYNVCSLVCLIQSSVKVPEFCCERVRNFFKEKGKLIKEISNEEFMVYVNSRLEEEKKKDTKLKEEFERNLTEIIRERYEFDKKEKNVKYLEKCNREDFIKFWEKYFEKEVAILDCEYVCQSHYDENEKKMKEVNDNEIPSIKKRVVAETINDFKKANQLFPYFNSETIQ